MHQAKFPEDFCHRHHPMSAALSSLGEPATSYLAAGFADIWQWSLLDAAGDTIVSAIGGGSDDGFVVKGDGVTTFEVWYMQHEPEPWNYQTAEQINEYLQAHNIQAPEFDELDIKTVNKGEKDARRNDHD
jgi:hypothetical protein